MTQNAKKTKASTLAHVQALIAGTQKHFPTGSLTFGNATTTSAALVKLLQGLVDALTTVVAAQKNAKDAVTALHAAEAIVDPTLRAFESFLHAMFGNSAQALADFDLVPHKARKKLTSVQSAAKASRAKATRALRGTKGSHAKAAIKAPAETTSQTTVPKP
jgi:hypothetical protein